MGDAAFYQSPIFELSNLTSLESIEIGNDCFGIVSEFTLSNLTSLQSIEIGDECFESVLTFKIDGLNGLKTINIGKNSFYGRIKILTSFHILNCESLKSIQIGEFSFSDFAGEFELKNLPQLLSIQIGTIGSRSCNFRNSSFVIRGIELILNI